MEAHAQSGPRHHGGTPLSLLLQHIPLRARVSDERSRDLLALRAARAPASPQGTTLSRRPPLAVALGRNDRCRVALQIICPCRSRRRHHGALATPRPRLEALPLPHQGCLADRNDDRGIASLFRSLVLARSQSSLGAKGLRDEGECRQVQYRGGELLAQPRLGRFELLAHRGLLPAECRIDGSRGRCALH